MSPAPLQGPSNGSSASPHGSLGPPPPRPLTKKRPHRRSPQACDECRLRKRACDAVDPCRPCQRGGLKCTYQFRRPVPPPTLRIRNLQDHLSLARTWLQHIKDNVSNVPGLDLDECLRTLDFTQPNPNDAPSPTTANAPTPGKSPNSASSTPVKTGIEQSSPSVPALSRHNSGSMLAGCHRTATSHSGELCFHGAFSDLSFALGIIELFRQGPTVEGQNALEGIQQSFAKPLEEQSHDIQSESLFLSEQSGFLDTHLEQRHLMISFLPIQRLSDVSLQFSSPSNFIPLLHLSLALHHLTSYQVHRSQTCQIFRARARSHLQEGISLMTLESQDSLALLQACLCAANIMLLLGRMPAAHSFISMAASMALRLDLLVKQISTSFRSEKRPEKIQAIATLLALDMLLSLILDIPTSLPRHIFEETDIVTLAEEFESQRDLRTAALLRQVCLLLVPMSIREHWKRAPTTSAQTEASAVRENIRLLETAHAAFRRWKRDVSPLLTSLGPSNEDRNIIKDLEMMYNFCQIIVFRSHLHHLRSVAVGGSMSKAQSYHALACLKIATSTIGHGERPTDTSELISFANSWLSMYTIFSAAMCLVFLIAAHPGTAYPSVAWQRARKGIRILAACSCGNNIAAACLEVIKIVTTELSHTVDFDYQEIETATQKVCDGEQSRSSQSGPSPSLSAEGSSAFMDNPADRMLFQADTLKAEFDFGDILNLSDGEV